jgi:type II secretory pathway component PulK
MSCAILGLVTLLNINIGTASAMERVAIVSSLALGGTAIGRNPEFPVTGHPEKQKFADGSELEVVAISENSKLNINVMLKGNQRDTLRALLRIWRLTDVEADTVLDCLFDYVEPGPARRLNGAKAEQYRKAGRPAPPGRPFRSIDEMASVLNFDLVTRRKENWREYFTIYGDGSLDVTTAPMDLIKAVCGVGDSSAKTLMNRRSQAEASPLDLNSVGSLMGLTDKEFGDVRDRIAVGGKVRRVTAEARFAQARRKVEAIFQLDDKGVTILDWKEW